MLTLLILLNAYFVSFTDKPTKTAPQLSPRAIEQRAKWNIPTDEMDYPVCGAYIDSLRRMGATVYHKSRWFNGVTVEMNATQASKVAQLSFVSAVEMTRDNSSSNYSPRKKRIENTSLTENSIQEAQTPDYTAAQLATYNLTPLHNAGFEGQDILMAICDGSFYRANTMTCFRQTQELGHFDFTDDENKGYTFYGSTGEHGTKCLSSISGIMSGYRGAATQANYYLMRSEEEDTESPKEMDNLVAALEKADSLGVNVFSVSLGYAMFDNGGWDLNKNTDLDGQTTRCSRAATIAARKGMLVCVAAGNEGDAPWGTIGAPADADSILTVGAVDIDSIAGRFSSYGPSSDGRIKPEVCAVGVQTTLINPSGYIVNSSGTSFAAPLIAGLAASLWSALPDENNMQIRERIIRSSDRYTHPDYANYVYGYGIPDAWKAYTMTLTDIPHTQPESRHQKILYNGQVVILHDGQLYDIMGRRIE